MKRVLDVGQCWPDHTAIRRLVEKNFAAKVVQVHDLASTLEQLRAGSFDLVLINRKLDIDYSDGLEILKAIKADPQLSSTPVMLVTNYEEYQQQAVAAGAVPGFGKNHYHDPTTRERLAAFLG